MKTRKNEYEIPKKEKSKDEMDEPSDDRPKSAFDDISYSENEDEIKTEEKKKDDDEDSEGDDDSQAREDAARERFVKDLIDKMLLQVDNFI